MSNLRKAGFFTLNRIENVVKKILKLLKKIIERLKFILVKGNRLSEIDII